MTNLLVYFLLGIFFTSFLFGFTDGVEDDFVSTPLTKIVVFVTFSVFWPVVLVAISGMWLGNFMKGLFR